MRVFFCIIILFCKSAFGQPPDGDSNWQLVFNDEFTDLSNWNISHWYDAGSNGSVALLKNVNIVNNCLELTAMHEFTPCASNYLNNPINNPSYPQTWFGCNQVSYDFNHGAVFSKCNNFTYGYYEIKAKMDLALGHWPAFVIYGGSGASSLYSETDIFEMKSGTHPFLGFNDGNNYHKNNPDNGIYGNKMNQFDMTTNIHGYGTPTEEAPRLNFVNDYTQWHKYGFEYWPNKMIWYVDNIVVRSITGTLSGFTNTMSMMVNLCNSFDKDAFFSSNTLSIPNLEQANFTIDYFKYFQLKGSCTPLSFNNVCYNFLNHTDTPKNNYNIGNTCNNYVPSDKRYVFKALNEVLIKDEFYVPLGSEVLIDAVNYCLKPITAGNGCGLSMNPCDYDFLGFDNMPKQYIELGGSNNCNVIVHNSDSVKLNAKEYIRLREGFSVPINSEIEIKILNCN